MPKKCLNFLTSGDDIANLLERVNSLENQDLSNIDLSDYATKEFVELNNTELRTVLESSFIKMIDDKTVIFAPIESPKFTGSISLDRYYEAGWLAYTENNIGEKSYSVGNKNKALGKYSHAEGNHTEAREDCSHSEGLYTISESSYQHVQGKYNISDSHNLYAHIVGNGLNESNRSNAHTLDWNGNAWFQGDVFIKGTNQDDGQKLATEAMLLYEIAQLRAEIEELRALLNNK